MPAALGNLVGALSEIIGSTEAPSARKRVEKVGVRCKNIREVQNGCDLRDNDSLSSEEVAHFMRAFCKK